MRYIELVKDIRSSALAFGCAPILGSKGYAESKAAVNAALDAGINHFDLARSYGFGEAEAFIGKCVSGKRNAVVLASKFGIAPNWKAKVMTPFKPLYRIIKGKKQGAQVGKPTQTSSSDRLLDRLPIDSKLMVESLEISLKNLRTDYLDYFFIHETHQTVERIDEVLEAAIKLKSTGKIRAFGIAFMRSQHDLHKSYLQYFDVLQFDCSPGAQAYDEWKDRRGGASNILFSPLSGGDPNISPKDKLLRLQADFPNSVIVSSMFNTRHLLDNAKLFK